MRKLKLLLAGCALMSAPAVWAQAIGDIVTVDGAEYQVTGTNIIVNGSFDDGVNGWYAGAWADADASKYNLQTEGGFDGGAYLLYSAGGAGADTNIRNKWTIDNGKTYLFRCYTSGKTPDSNNLQYSFLAYYDEAASNNEGTKIGFLKWGADAAQESDTWTVSDIVFTATADVVCFRSSWTDNTKVDGFFLGEVTRYYSPEGYNKAMEDAQAALENADYVNVTGDEKTNLENTITTYTGVSSDKYEEAIEALDAATKAFTEAKAAYDALATANAAIVDLTYALDSKKPAAATAVTAAAAQDAAANVYVALRPYYESHAKAEAVTGATDMTSLIQNPDATDGNNGWDWTGNKNDPRNTESWTDSEGGNEHMYFDGGNWGGSNWTTTMSQTISLPAGRYLLTAKGRAAVNTTLTMSVGEASVELPHVGNSGNVFDRGWNDGSVEFETRGEDIAIVVSASAEPTREWFSIGDFRLVQLEGISVPMADGSDYTALATAIQDAEAIKLGFAVGEYAPYTNVDALKALAAAKKIDPEAETGNTKEVVQDATNTLTSATWTANTAEMDPIYDSTFEDTEANTTSGDIDLPGWTKVQGIRLLLKDEYNDPGIAYTDSKAALFAWGGTTLTYGEQTGYTLPMAKYEMYELTLKVAGWRDGDLPDYMSVDMDGAIQSINPNVAYRINDAENNPFVEVKFYVMPTEDNSILKIFVNHHFAIADLNLKKAEPLTATVTVDSYATFVSDAPLDFSETEIKAYTATIDGDKVVLTQIDRVPARTPVVLYKQGGKADEIIPFANTTDEVTDNQLVRGTGAAVPTFDESGNTNYVLNNASGIGFYYAAGLPVPTNRAYLSYNSSTTRLSIVFAGEATGIKTIDNVLLNSNAVYNLSGQRVQKAQKGLYITNGKKVVVK